MKSRTLKAAMFMALALLLGFGSAADAVLQAVGAPHPVNGFPTSYTDTIGTSLGLCTDPVNCIVTPPVVGNAFSQTIGFGDEMFYYFAESDLLTVGPQVPGGETDTALLRMLLEAAFDAGPPAAGDQITFVRINFKQIVSPNTCSAANLIDCVLAPNTTYSVTHPMGAFDFATDATGTANLGLAGQAFRAEIGCGAVPCDFSAVLPQTLFGPFLTALAPPPPAGFIGNPAILQTITGGVNNNTLTVSGPNIGGPGVDVVSTNLWTVAGQRLGSFQDVPVTHLFFNQIEAIASAGITAGCSANPPLFCPDSSITRKEMAVFLETSLGVPPPAACTGTVFNDVTPLTVGQAFCNFIEDFATRGITGGCAADDPGTPANEAMFCPEGLVTRAQMAVFIEIALGTVIPPPCTEIQFGDVNATVMSTAFCGFIEQLAADGITGGCAAGPPPLFCPDSPVTRGQMAVFLVAAPPPLLP